MSLEPGWRGDVIVNGESPKVRAINQGPAPTSLVVEAPGVAESVTLAPNGGYHDTRVPGPARFIFTNTEDETTYIELRAVRYRSLIVDRSPGPIEAGEQP